MLATALLGADQPHLTVGELVAIASLFGISDGAARTCLWRMVSTGELAVVSVERRSAGDRLALRTAAAALPLAELREGIWDPRPDNLDPDRLPTLRAVLDRQRTDAKTPINAGFWGVSRLLAGGRRGIYVRRTGSTHRAPPGPRWSTATVGDAGGKEFAVPTHTRTVARRPVWNSPNHDR